MSSTWYARIHEANCDPKAVKDGVEKKKKKSGMPSRQDKQCDECGMMVCVGGCKQTMDRHIAKKCEINKEIMRKARQMNAGQSSNTERNTNAMHAVRYCWKQYPEITLFAFQKRG